MDVEQCKRQMRREEDETRMMMTECRVASVAHSDEVRRVMAWHGDDGGAREGRKASRKAAEGGREGGRPDTN